MLKFSDLSLNDRCLGCLIVAYLVSIVLFDLVTRQLGGMLFDNVGVNDLLLFFLVPAFLITIVNSKCRMINVASIVGVIAIIYIGSMSLLSLSYGAEAFVRDSQFTLRFMPLVVLPVILIARPFLFEWFMQQWSVLLWCVCVVALLQVLMATVIGIEIIPWARGRSGVGLRQATSLFYEPAVCAQFLAASLFILFFSDEGVGRHRRLFYLTLVTMVLTQSLGGLFAAVTWVGVRTLRSGGIDRLGRAIAIVGVLLVALLIFFALAPTNRYSIFLGSETMEVDGSAGRRVLVEYIALSEFLKTADWGNIAIGLPSIEAKYFRNMSHIVTQKDGIAGNGIVEIILRYGILGFANIVICMMIWFWANPARCCRVFIFFGLLAQMDGAISKPWIFAYTSIYISYEYFQYIRWGRFKHSLAGRTA